MKQTLSQSYSSSCFSTWRRGWFSTALILSLCLSARVAALAADYVPFAPTLQAGALCEVKVAVLHPTQFCLGQREVQLRARKISELRAKKLDAYLAAHVVPIVIGPDGVPYILDNHHFACAIKEAGVRETVHAKVKENWADVKGEEFWARMKNNKWVYLYVKGVGPLEPSALPAHLADMTDDPYRSLAWAVRDRGGYTKSDDVPYADFQWADFFRTRVKVGNAERDFNAAVEQALPLAQSAEAKALPGYVEKSAGPDLPAPAEPRQLTVLDVPSNFAGVAERVPMVWILSEPFE